MTRLVAVLVLLVGIGLWYRYSFPVIRRDIIKFRAWRERMRQWRAAESAPPSDYRRDNLLWKLRLTALIVSTVAFAALTVFLFAFERAPLEIWLLTLLTVIFFTGAAVWGGMADSVR
jgi:hypothetical protein